jgi:hypothetical protein
MGFPQIIAAGKFAEIFNYDCIFAILLQAKAAYSLSKMARRPPLQDAPEVEVPHF